MEPINLFTQSGTASTLLFFSLTGMSGVLTGSISIAVPVLLFL